MSGNVSKNKKAGRIPEVSKSVARKRKRDEEEDTNSESTRSGENNESGSESGSEEGSEVEEDAEGRRISQWVDEDDLEVYERTGGESEQRDIQKDLASLSFGALLKAKRTIAREASSASGSSRDSDDETEQEDQAGQADVHPYQKERKEKVKRANKHAPMEMTSKRPVSRKRIVVDMASVKFRDPRFGEAAGDFSADHFRKDYGFLSDVRQEELGTIKESLARAKKLLASSPEHLREERREVVEKLERTMKRSESAIERGKREAFERDIMAQVKRDERDKRSQGKGAWYLKKGDEKKVKLQARFESLSGKEAKKVMEKKQKKIAQKEKKSRPFAVGSGYAGNNNNGGEGSGPTRKRRLVEGGDPGSMRKRKRV